MKLISWNVRGLGNPGAKNALRQLLVAEKPDVLFVSESKLSSVEFERYCRSCGYINVFAENSDGASGGVGLCWNDTVNINPLSSGFYYIDAEIIDDGDGNHWRLTGFYGQPDPNLRHESWSLLRDLATHSDLPWLCIGDYNEILYSYEKRGGRRRNRNQMLAFRNAVTETELIDLGYHGIWYTWQRGGINSPLIRCRLDRGLANEAWWELVPNFVLKHLVNSHSDHSPLLLLTGSSNDNTNSVGLPPKRFCASWIHDNECEEVVRSCWEATAGSVTGKIPAVLDALLRWSSIKFQGRKKKKRKLQKKLDRLASLEPDDAVLNEMIEVKTALNFEIDQEEALWAQRAHINWLKEGDRNTAFFHKSASHRRRKNTVRGLQSAAGSIEQTTAGMLTIAVDYFTNLFTTSSPDEFEVILNGIETKIDDHTNDVLCREYSADEIKEAVFSMGPNKASGPDGMTALFFQRFWSIVGTEVSDFCMGVLNGDRDIEDINSTNIILLPKIDNPDRMQHFRPISLSNVLYKIIAKTLANRLKGVLASCIDPSQSAFIPGRLITDNILIAYELLHTLKNSRTGSNGRFALKMDMSKAYDRVEWGYLEAMMLKMGFHDTFVSKIMSCVKTVSYSVILNGSVSETFRPTRGIRQGDPLSTYLFLICSEGLSSLLRTAQSGGLISGMQASSNGPALTHLLFADDAIIFGETSATGASRLRDVIYTYGRCSGQQVNYDKSLIYFSSNSSSNLSNAVKALLRVRVENNPEKYLGLPCMVGRDRTTSFQYLRDKMYGRIQGWTTRFLSHAGKEVFIKSILQSLPTYAMGCFLLPKGLCNKMNGIMSKYWWRGREDNSGMYWAKWSKVCRPKSQGGLGFRDLCKFNVAMLVKQGWRLVTNPDSLVARVLKAKYFPNTSFLEARVGSSPSLTWRSVWSARGLLEKGLCWRIGNEISTRMWFDQWVPGLPIYKLSPKITRLNPIGRVAEYIDYHTMQWKEDRLREVLIGADVERIIGIPLPRTPAQDTLGWQYTNTGEYSVSSGYMVLMGCHPSQLASNGTNLDPTHANFYKKLWQTPLPPKILHHIWRVFKNYAATNYIRYHRYISNSPICPRCGIEEETMIHTFRDCTAWSGAWRMLNIIWDPGTASESLQTWLLGIVNSADQKAVMKILTVIWAVWTDRNKLIHQGITTTPVQLKFFVESYLREIEVASGSRQIRAPREQAEAWKPPQSPMLKANFDAGFDKNTDTGYAGVVIRNHSGVIKAAAGFVIERITSPYAAEAAACLMAMQIAYSLQFIDVIFEGDAKSVVNYLNNPAPNRSIIAPTIIACKQYSNEFRNCLFQYSPRNTNRCAHTLAKHRRSWVSDRLWIDEIPAEIEQLVMAESSS